MASALSFAVRSCCCCCCGFGGPEHVPLAEMPAVHLDAQHMGSGPPPYSQWTMEQVHNATSTIPVATQTGTLSEQECMDVVLLKSDTRICGAGGCLANAPLNQNKSYFELKIHSSGVWGVGVATKKANLDQIPMGQDTQSLVLRHDGSVYFNDEERSRLPANSLPQEGDVVGITYDHVELNIYLNGKNMNCPASGIRGTVFPVIYVDDSTILDCQFSDFHHSPPQGFEKILFEQQIF